MTVGPPLTQQCSSCPGRAIFATPYGRLCLHHTLEEMASDGDPWMPQTLDDPPRRPNSNARRRNETTHGEPRFQAPHSEVWSPGFEEGRRS